jgi:hypothetical protein
LADLDECRPKGDEDVTQEGTFLALAQCRREPAVPAESGVAVEPDTCREDGEDQQEMHQAQRAFPSKVCMGSGELGS